ncbi:MAG TPA: prolyl oligopeptidase family serine peptidase [Usitatibacter sp.]|nr:prolyl oligopeptidase family serine peptidase [Usitatibacter sp.]
MRLATFIGAFVAATALGSKAQAPAPAPASTPAPAPAAIPAANPEEPLRELEDASRPETQAFFREEGARARATLDKLPGRAAMLDRIRALSAASPEVTALAATNTPRIFYLRRAGKDPVPVLCFREKPGAPERVLVDPSRFARAGAGAASIDWFVPSPDARHVAYGVSRGGSEDSVLRVISVEGASDLPIEIDRARFGDGLAWHPDGRSFFYPRVPEAGPDQKRLANIRVYRHVLGRDASKDEIVFAPGVGGARDVPEFDRPSIYIPPESRYAYAIARDGVRREIAVHVTDLRDLADAKPRWRKIVGYQDEILSIVGSGDDLFLLSHQGAPRRKVLRLKGGKDLDTAKVAIPQGDSVIRTVAIARDAIYLRTMVAGIDRLERVAISLLGNTKTAEYVRTPFDTSIAQLVANPRIPGALLRIQGWIEPPAIVEIDTHGEAQATHLQPPTPPAAEFDTMDEVRLYAPASDGTKIPVTLIYRKSTTLTRENPTLLEGYGSFGTSLTPVFDATRLAWLERGGILAVAHVRGGGEYGETWREAGYGAGKATTIADFVAVSDYLIKYGFTSPRKLAIIGTGAGAIAVGGALVRRPDLYAAAVLRSPLADMMRLEAMTTGAAAVPEFGSVSTAAGHDQLRMMSTLHYVRDGTPYPAVLVTTGLNDSRVAPWQGAKLVARLESASTSGKPVLFRVDPEAGYGGGVTRAQRDEELADIYSFLMWQMTEAAVAPSAPPASAPASTTAPTAEAAPASAPAEPVISQPPLTLPPSIFAPKPQAPEPSPK